MLLFSHLYGCVLRTPNVSRTFLICIGDSDKPLLEKCSILCCWAVPCVNVLLDIYSKRMLRSASSSTQPDQGLLSSRKHTYIILTSLNPNFHIVKLGFTGVYILIFISAHKHRLWVLVRTASSMFWAEIWKISEFLSENFQFLLVNFSIYLNKCVFVMCLQHYSILQNKSIYKARSCQIVRPRWWIRIFAVQSFSLGTAHALLKAPYTSKIDIL